MNTESRGIVVTFLIQMAILVVGWMITSWITRHGFTWTDGYPNFGKTFLHHGLWFSLVPIGWLLMSRRMMTSGSRWATLVVMVGGPAVVIIIVLLLVKAFIAGGLGGGGMIIGTVK
jgi:hypothetical protein